MAGIKGPAQPAPSPNLFGTSFPASPHNGSYKSGFGTANGGARPPGGKGKKSK